MTDRRGKPQPVLARDVGPFDAKMLVMGGMVGAVIFMNPSAAAGQVHSLVLNLLARTAGGVVALIEAFIYTELANRIPEVGGQHASLREAYHSLIVFF